MAQCDQGMISLMRRNDVAKLQKEFFADSRGGLPASIPITSKEMDGVLSEVARLRQLENNRYSPEKHVNSGAASPSYSADYKLQIGGTVYPAQTNPVARP